MAFPGTHNISYYKGDTHEFRIYPKTSNGDAFPLAGYSVKFAFAESRGGSGVASYHEAYAQIVDNSYILCAIKPETASSGGDSDYLTPGVAYVYDVQISKPGTPYALVHTILTGGITVTDQVSEAAPA